MSKQQLDVRISHTRNKDSITIHNRRGEVYISFTKRPMDSAYIMTAEDDVRHGMSQNEVDAIIDEETDKFNKASRSE